MLRQNKVTIWATHLTPTQVMSSIKYVNALVSFGMCFDVHAHILHSLTPRALHPPGLLGSVREREGYRRKLSGMIPSLYLISAQALLSLLSLLGNPGRKSLTCLDMEHNCPKTGPDPNKQGAKLSQTGLDTKTKTGAVRIMLQSPCNGQWWGKSLAGAFLLSLIVQLALKGRCCSDSSDDLTDCSYFLIKIVC